MPPKPETEVQLEIGHVLFIDIVGYSKALIDDQRALQQDLNDVVRNTEQFRTAESAGKLIRCAATGGIFSPRRDRARPSRALWALALSSRNVRPTRQAAGFPAAAGHPGR
jgi:hypothetical protein